jgi:hypothetical protein
MGAPAQPGLALGEGVNFFDGPEDFKGLGRIDGQGTLAAKSGSQLCIELGVGPGFCGHPGSGAVDAQDPPSVLGLHAI